jgi:hypothetical protein
VEPAIWVPATAGVLGALITAAFARIPRRERSLLAGKNGVTGNGNGGGNGNGANGSGHNLVRLVIEDRARIEAEHSDMLRELRRSHDEEIDDLRATVSNLRARLGRCEDQRDRLIRGDGSKGGPGWRPDGWRPDDGGAGDMRAIDDVR